MNRRWPILLFFTVLLLGTPALSQGCALCYTQAAASGTGFVRALRMGIFTLVVPAMSITSAMIWMAYRKRHYYGSAAAAGYESGTEDGC
jgi:hypothetical protein